MKLGASLQSFEVRSILDQVEKAIELDFETLQIFLAERSIMPSTAECFKDAERVKYLIEQSGLEVYVHAPLMISPVHAEAGKRKTAAYSISKHMRIAYLLGFKAVVLHPGSTKGDWRALLNDTLSQVFDGSKFYGDVKLLLENAAGQGNMIASLQNLVDFVSKSEYNISICVDTAHAWAFGHDVLSEEFNTFLHENKELISLIHLNNPDTIVQMGSHKDRHRAGYDNGRFTREQMFGLSKVCSKFPCVMEAFYIEELPTYIRQKQFVASATEGENLWLL